MSCAATQRSSRSRQIYQPGGAPPPHLHPAHDETFEIVEGTLHAVVGGRTLDLSAGQGLEVPRGVVHCMWNVTDALTRVHWISTPAQTGLTSGSPGWRRWPRRPRSPAANWTGWRSRGMPSHIGARSAWRRAGGR